MSHGCTQTFYKLNSQNITSYHFSDGHDGLLGYVPLTQHQQAGNVLNYPLTQFQQNYSRYLNND